MSNEQKIELHSKKCSCGGGSWMLFGGVSSSPCAGSPSARGDYVVLDMAQWRDMGRPANAEEHIESAERREEGERREFQRFEAAIQIRLSRVPRWKTQVVQAEETETEVIAKGGALVRTRMAIDRGEMLVLEVRGEYKSRAEVMYANPVVIGPGERCLRVGLRFLDAPFPAKLIPKDATPI